MRSQKPAFVFLVLNATAVFCAPTADPSSVHELDINARAKGSEKKTNPSTTSNTKCRRGKSSGGSTPKPKRDLHARAKSSQTSSTGLTLCGAKGSTTSTSSPDSAQSDTGEADTYSPLSRTNTQTSRLKVQLTASKADAKGQGQICDYTVDITVLDRIAFENLACPSFDALAGIIEKSKAEQLKLKEE
ncbi:uncharacterized protein ARMOST_10919 [Armillaria ostoyae]|uniref:Uncharacterized protein n=1 Tax=Armillaria ostoyae TaxID=47428 RepID=A0A284RFN4_ARMOS|nr:uncharacterized protein ARMOST_10919 [Armillaria ostoyae]